jgi:hypothetical protein
MPSSGKRTSAVTERITGDRNVPSEDNLFFTPGEKELCRQLFEQLYANSVARYGVDSEQARMLSELLSAGTGKQIEQPASR